MRKRILKMYNGQRQSFTGMQQTIIPDSLFSEVAKGAQPVQVWAAVS